jgi:uncharacterized protein (TIGR02266 family)
MTDFSDRRKQPRIELILKVEYPASADFVADYACDASGGGLFIATSRTFSAGDIVSFDISFPGLLSPIRCRGEVRWIRSGNDASEEKPAGIGVSFLFEDDRAKREMEELVESFRSLQPAKEEKDQPEQEISDQFRVLIVEDSKMVREMFRFAMRKMLHMRVVSQHELKVVEAEDGKAAWDLLQNEPFDLAIFDYYMPVMNGGELIRKIREKAELKSLPIIVVSSGGKDVRAECYLAGADLFVDKPIMLAQLFDCVQRLIAMKRIQQEKAR